MDKVNLGAQFGLISVHNYPDRFKGYDGFVNVPTPDGRLAQCVVDDKHRVGWDAKVAVVRLMVVRIAGERVKDKFHYATISAKRGAPAERFDAKLKYSDEALAEEHDVVLVARTPDARGNPRFGVFVPKHRGQQPQPRAAL